MEDEGATMKTQGHYLREDDVGRPVSACLKIKKIWPGVAQRI